MAWRVLEKLEPRRKIGDVLIELGFITPSDLKDALKQAKPGGPRVGTMLVKNGIITEQQLAKALGAQFKMEFLDLSGIVPTAEALQCLPENVAREQVVLPLSIENQTLSIAVYDPLNVMNIQTVSRMTKYELNVRISSEKQLRTAIDAAYSKGDMLANIVKELTTNSAAKTAAKTAKEDAKNPKGKSAANPNLILVDKSAAKDSASIESLVNRILERAVTERASDIHIEPDEHIIRVRERVDGLLREVSQIPIELAPSLVSRIKILANLDFAEKRNAQDGRFRISIGARQVDLRISTLPTVRGEKVVLRILDQSSLNVKLDQIGFSKHNHAKLTRILEAPFGIIFVTGPTGSGKSTTVYSMLNHLNSPEKNIITVEDPVEYQLGSINQVQVQPKIGFTFASVLRSILRQDPDIIMVGEIRDKETADIAVRAALTGHLVITTLHTNSSVSTITRLIDMGVDPSLISGSLLGVVSQRLVRKLCPVCRVEGKIDEVDLHRLSSLTLSPGTKIFHPKGCPSCQNLGYRGRAPIFEILTPDLEVRKAIVTKQSEEFIFGRLQKSGNFVTMREDGIQKIIEGVTTPNEVIKATVNGD